MFTQRSLNVHSTFTECPLNVHSTFTEHSLQTQVPVEHGLLVENLLDLAHAPFAHTSTFAKGMSGMFSDMIKSNVKGPLAGGWEPCPIEISFEAPCITVSTIGLAQPGQAKDGMHAVNCEKSLHQMHVCLPSKEGHTRLLYRMALDFTPWSSAVPMIGSMWTQRANQVLEEDLQLLLGQQKNMQGGGNTWANPVASDKLAMQYRRWRNSVAAETTPYNTIMHVSMTAGELLAENQLLAEDDER
mmetsp:Transcript_31599/g.53083  ORF Transcript_31599/g.53083 Transcript_31599/m.53083 type:complete len:243 (-) Transcript_31599:367-1095(-)